MFTSIEDHHKVCQEPPCPPRLQEQTWRTGGVLTGFLRSNLRLDGLCHLTGGGDGSGCGGDGGCGLVVVVVKRVLPRLLR